MGSVHITIVILSKSEEFHAVKFEEKKNSSEFFVNPKNFT
jgi:hypothetical protein